MNKRAITTERLILRALQDDDLDDMIAILMDESIKKTYMLPDFPTEKDAYPLLQKLQLLSADPTRFVYGIEAEGRIVGLMNDVEIKEDQIEVGYVIHPGYQNRGYATEALTALIRELHSAGFRSVRAGFFQENAASMRVMEKAGMVKIPYEDDIEYRGKMHHCLFFGSLRCDDR